MAIQYREAQGTNNPIANIQPSNPNLLPDIPYSPFQENPSAAETTNAPIGDGGITLAGPLPTSVPTPSFFSATITPSSIINTTSSPTTSRAAAAQGLTPGKLTAAIVIPLAFLAVIIPIIVFSYLGHKRRKEEQQYAAHRASQRRSRERENWSEKQQKPSAPVQPQRVEERSRSTQKKSEQPRTQQPTRHSLGLFNFELSTPTSPTPTNAPATPNFRLSIARALEMRRSDVAVVQSHNRISGQSGELAQRRSQERQQSARRMPTNNDSRTSVFDPPPPYASPRPSDAQAQTSVFAPLERIGTRNVAERRSHITRQLKNSAPAATIPSNNALRPQPSHTPRVSSEILRSPEAYGRVQTRSTSTTSNSGMSAHNNGPFSYGLPERLSDISGLSFDVSQWSTDHPRGSYRASVVSAVSSDESSTMHPHQII